ncbi:MAG TPA: ABC transporter permease DevC [Alphaproteobacteria bacterium]|nr:ABC transporter permease DevC [Alphaproteobacteria bacterium]
MSLYASQTPWKNPMTGVNRTALVLGIDPRSTVYNLPGLREVQEKLHMHDAVLFDEYSRPEFGPVKDMVEKNGVFSAEIGGKQLDVVDTFRMGITFSADGNIIVKDTTFFKIFPNKSADGIDVGIVSLQKGADIETAKNKIRSLLPENILVLNREEYIEEEKAYWNDITPIGYIFNFGVIMGLIVGFVIVYQVLFNDINNHLHEYATLKAIGYDDYYFTKVVISASIILAVGGYIPGFLICAVLYKIVESSIFIEMDLNFIKAITTFVLISSMCFLSGLLAIRKLKSANPVDVFQ